VTKDIGNKVTAAATRAFLNSYGVTTCLCDLLSRCQRFCTLDAYVKSLSEDFKVIKDRVDSSARSVKKEVRHILNLPLHWESRVALARRAIETWEHRNWNYHRQISNMMGPRRVTRLTKVESVFTGPSSSKLTLAIGVGE